MLRWALMGLAVLAAGAVTVSAVLAGLASGDPNEWATKATQLDGLQADGLTGDGVRIAILDTGIDVSHPGLRHLHNGRMFDGELREYRDFVGGPGPADQSGHGTFIAGLLAGAPEKGFLATGPDVAGLTPRADLYIGRICAEGDCSLYTLRDGLAWALRLDVDVISLSVGFTAEQLKGRESLVDSLLSLLAQAERDGVLVVAAAGQGGHLLFPASEPAVLSVGAVGESLAPMRNDLCLARPDILAPGDDIRGPGLEGSIVRMKGSSVAVPFVVAAAALILEGNPALKAEGLRDALMSSARPIPGGCAGLLQADAAQAWARGA